MAAAAAQHGYAFPRLSDAELQFVVDIFSQLPADQLLRCAEVSRSWRATVALPALWRRLDLSPESGVAQRNLTALLHAAVARAGGALRTINVSGTNLRTADIGAALRAAPGVVEVHALTRDLSVFDDENYLSVSDVTVLLASAPQLRELHVDVRCGPEDAVSLLVKRPRLEAVRVRSLDVEWTDEASAAALGAAVRASSVLKSLSMREQRLGVLVVQEVFGALVGHCSLQVLDVLSSSFDDTAAAGAALAALLAADAPALEKVNVDNCCLDEDSLGALVDALPRNHHLRKLHMSYNDTPTSFMRARMLPAVVANESLRELSTYVLDFGLEGFDDEEAAVEEAHRIVAAR